MVHLPQPAPEWTEEARAHQRRSAFFRWTLSPWTGCLVSRWAWLVGCPEAQWLRWGRGSRRTNNALPCTQDSKGRRFCLEPSCPISKMLWGEGVDAGLHVRLLGPDRASFQSPRPWRKQITSGRKQLLLTWRAERCLMEQLGHHRNPNGKSSLIKHLGAVECGLFAYVCPSPRCLSAARHCYFSLSSNTEIIF